MDNFEEHKLHVYTRNLGTILILSMLLFLRSYSMAKSKPQEHLLKFCKHPQTSENNIAQSYKNSQSISRSLVVKFNTSCHYFFSKLSCIIHQLLKINISLESRCTTFNLNIVKVSHFSSFIVIFCYYFILTETFFALSESWELVFSHWIT